MKSITKAFTLIELLIVIVIIGVLAVALIPRLTGAQARARDTARMADLRQIQSALELYAADNSGRYPSTLPGGTGGWRGNCIYYGGFPTLGLSGYIPNLAPDYITELPLDPRPIGNNECYLYRSDGRDYMMMAYGTVEGNVPPEFIRHMRPIQRNFAIYTPGAKMW